MRQVVPSKTWREAIARRTRRLRAEKYLKALIKEKGLVKGAALERVIEGLIEQYPDLARQCAVTPRNRGWFEGRAMALLQGRIELAELGRIVALKIESFNATR